MGVVEVGREEHWCVGRLEFVGYLMTTKSPAGKILVALGIYLQNGTMRFPTVVSSCANAVGELPSCVSLAHHTHPVAISRNRLESILLYFPSCSAEL